MALDCHPYSIVHDTGFVSLLRVLEPRYAIPSQKYFTDTVIPKLHDEVKDAVMKQITCVSYISLTTDIWSTDLNSCSLMSLTAHWLSQKFERKSAILFAQPFDSSHTGEAICKMVLQMLQLWELGKERIHLVIRDNAANMVKGMTDAGLPDLGCFAHTLQLVIHDGILSQRVVIDMLATSRKIVGHFRRSNLAYSRLKDIQKNLGLPAHRLVQDEPTRWNSTLYMLQRLIEQKMALGAYATEYSIPQLTPHQVTLANKVIKIMAPIEEVTKSISADAATVSVIIPFVRILSKTLSQNDEDSGVRTMKNEMKSSLMRRFSNIEENEKLTVATLLDPRFKDKFFTGQLVKTRVESSIRTMISDLKGLPVETDEVDIQEPSPKRPCTEMWQSYTEILEEAGAVFTDVDSADELDTYIAEPLISFERENCFSWWENNMQRFPYLAKLAERYLGAPPTSVPSERLFSGAGNLYDEKRNRLAPDNAEILLFIKNNIKFI